MCAFISNVSLSGMWCGLLLDISSKFRTCLVVSSLRVETPKKTNMLSRTFGQQLSVKWHHIPGKKRQPLLCWRKPTNSHHISVLHPE